MDKESRIEKLLMNQSEQEFFIGLDLRRTQCYKDVESERVAEQEIHLQKKKKEYKYVLFGFLVSSAIIYEIYSFMGKDIASKKPTQNYRVDEKNTFNYQIDYKEVN